MGRVKGYTDAPHELDNHHSRPEVDWLFRFKGRTYRMISSLSEEDLSKQTREYSRFGHNVLTGKRVENLSNAGEIKWCEQEDRIYHYHSTMSCKYPEATRVSFNLAYRKIKDAYTEHPCVEWSDNWIDGKFIVCVHVRGFDILMREISDHLFQLGLREHEEDLGCLELAKLSRRRKKCS